MSIQTVTECSPNPPHHYNLNMTTHQSNSNGSPDCLHIYEEIRSRLMTKNIAQQIKRLASKAYARGEITALPEMGESIIDPTKFIKTMDGSNRVDASMEAVKLYTTDPNKGWEKVVEETDDILKKLTEISSVQKGAFCTGTKEKAT